MATVDIKGLTFSKFYYFRQRNLQLQWTRL